jgi:hypothetical protein
MVADAQTRHDHKTHESAAAPIRNLAIINCALFTNGRWSIFFTNSDHPTSAQSIVKIRPVPDVTDQLAASGINIITTRLTDGRHYSRLIQDFCECSSRRN